jgi:hypothetical protein
MQIYLYHKARRSIHAGKNSAHTHTGSSQDPYNTSMAPQTLMGQGFFVNGGSRLYSGTPHSVTLLCTSDQLVTETSTLQHTTITTSMSPAGLEPGTPPASERPQTDALQRAATGTGCTLCTNN